MTENLKSISEGKLVEKVTLNNKIDSEDNPYLKELNERYEKVAENILTESTENKNSVIEDTRTKVRAEFKDIFKEALYERGLTITNKDFYENIKGLLEKNGLTNYKKLPTYEEVLELKKDSSNFIIKFSPLFRDKIGFFDSEGRDFGKFILSNGKFSRTFGFVRNDKETYDNNIVRSYFSDEPDLKSTPEPSLESPTPLLASTPVPVSTPEVITEPIVSEPKETEKNPTKQNVKKTNNKSLNNNLSSLKGKNWVEIHKNKEAVKEIQRILISKGYKLRVDGVVGPKTTDAIKKFQKENKINEDGKVGKITLEKLLLSNSKDTKNKNKK